MISFGSRAKALRMLVPAIASVALVLMWPHWQNELEAQSYGVQVIASIRLANALSGSSQFMTRPSVITSSYNFGVRSLPFVVTCVDQNTGQIIPNCDVTLTITSTLLSGGHFHSDPSFSPLRTGSLCLPNQSSCQSSQISGNTLSDGFNVIYTAPEAAGTIAGEITGSASGSPITSKNFTINVGINNLK